jgi:site-specific DNA recombinase
MPTNSHGRPHYRCGYPREYALAEHVKHPLNVYVPHRINDTVRALAACQETPQPAAATDLQEDDSDALLAACNAKLAKYRAALEAGVDPETVGAWITAVKTERAGIATRHCEAS